MVCRSRLLLARILRELGERLDEADVLERRGRKVLGRLLDLEERPAFLREVDDEMILVDNLQPLRGRFSRPQLWRAFRAWDDERLAVEKEEEGARVMGKVGEGVVVEEVEAGTTTA